MKERVYESPPSLQVRHQAMVDCCVKMLAKIIIADLKILKFKFTDNKRHPIDIIIIKIFLQLNTIPANPITKTKRVIVKK